MDSRVVTVESAALGLQVTHSLPQQQRSCSSTVQSSQQRMLRQQQQQQPRALRPALHKTAAQVLLLLLVKLVLVQPASQTHLLPLRCSNQQQQRPVLLGLRLRNVKLQ